MRRWLAYGAWLLLAAALHLFGNNAGSFAVLLASVLVPAVLAVLARCAVHNVRADFVLPADSGKNERLVATLLLRNASFLPLQRINCRVRCENKLTGECVERSLVLSLWPKQEDTVRFAVSAAHCGHVMVSVTELRVGDAFGLFVWPTGFFAARGVTVHPEGFPMDVRIVEHNNTVMDSDVYSMSQPGYDPSETYSIREYIPGDAIKSIHWKLSQKSDALLVRELGLPVVSQMLLLLETSMLADYKRAAPAEIDAMAEVFASVSGGLCDAGISHTLGWKDMETGLLVIVEVQTREDLRAAAERFLTNPFGERETTVVSCFRSAYALCAFAHVCVVGCFTPPDLDKLYNGNRITTLLCGGECELDGLCADGTLRFSFGAEEYQTVLGRLAL